MNEDTPRWFNFEPTGEGFEESPVGTLILLGYSGLGY
jgi:hypothetical protein